MTGYIFSKKTDETINCTDHIMCEKELLYYISVR